MMYFMFFSSVLAGLCLIGRMSSMIKYVFHRSKEEGAFVVSVIGFFNLAGRLFIGMASDKLGRRNTFLLIIGSQVIVLIAFDPIMKGGNYWAFTILSWIMCAAYGGAFGSVPAFIADMFGPSNIGICYGVVMTAW